MDLDAILTELGQFGKFQIITYMLISLPVIFSGITSITYVFTAGNLQYRCRIPECGDNGTEFNPQWLEHAVPMEQHGGHRVPSRCLRYEATNQSVPGDSCPAQMFLNSTVRCHDWVFDGDEYTIVRQWNITCDENKWKMAMVGTVNSVGQFVGLPLVGFLSDRFGRKLTLVGCLVTTSVLGIARSFSPSYIIFVIMEFVNMIMSGSIIFGAAFIIGVELVGPEKRVLGGVIINGLDAIGEVLVGLLAWWLHNWQTLLWACYAPAIIFISYYWLLPESVRWLMAQGRMKEAEAIIRKAAKTNGVELSDEVLHSFQNGRKNDDSTEASFGNVLHQVIRSKVLLLRLINCCFCWVTNTFVYFGLSLNSVAVGSNKYSSFILVCLIEIPGYMLTYFVLSSRMGRKMSLCLSLIFSGACCIAFTFVPADLEWLQLIMYLMGKFAITISFTTVYVYTAELFPTQLRHSLLGVCSMFGRVGSVVAPQTPLLERYMESLPLLLFGAMSLTSGVLALLFPETKNAKLPDTVEEAENIGTGRIQLPSAGESNIVVCGKNTSPDSS